MAIYVEGHDLLWHELFGSDFNIREHITICSLVRLY